ncbi:Predicted house-cleaning noncanonical NTP pyrophosphatase, all-alpha NTP-PPase (MazG) superfamily [Halogranum gelatinilyticum]|uniref:Predicted house-cleaning noncanonical NTP pyrophosphatase, all-alpha NTP-PPase (MazG) superfamily n=1 Tax=Halogranum gelatinilyticum TaxID=660521 RepID=A0A1G9TXW0_9EURY|nr:nucleoside triphosphate pyrophosphohydrolase [Halogranum gelatinilyticum]SDM52075.1 Predicted house-cleaning noncanonical NTP pyrophosphatase, all-alpha NTP-PPase (MazG) superfamily [Halogranum gelatinilyticum]
MSGGDERVVEYDKLVRDDIPEIIRADGEKPETHVADDTEYARRLREKLVEEAEEFAESGEIEELADVVAVVDAIGENRGVGWEELERRADEKASERGGFAEGIVLERVWK